MKKSRVLLTAFAVALSLGSVSVEAKSAKEMLDDSMDNVSDQFKAFRKKVKSTKFTKAQKRAAAAALATAAMAAATVAGYKAAPRVKEAGYVTTGRVMKAPGKGVLAAGEYAAGTRVGGATIRGSRAVYAAPGAVWAARPAWARRATVSPPGS